MTSSSCSKACPSRVSWPPSNRSELSSAGDYHKEQLAQVADESDDDDDDWDEDDYDVEVIYTR